jgi:hypothetical protein
MTKPEALAKYLEVDLNEISEGHDDNTFEQGREEYMVLTDDEADEKAREYILDSIWAFNASFLAAHSDLDEEVIRSIQDNGRCEGNNAVLTKLIGDLDHFVNDAILSDGRGHFMNSYDGQENEIFDRVSDFTSRYLYVYRMN